MLYFEVRIVGIWFSGGVLSLNALGRSLGFLCRTFRAELDAKVWTSKSSFAKPAIFTKQNDGQSTLKKQKKPPLSERPYQT